MIQRKQSIFLLISFIVLLVCLCLPIGSIEPKGMGAEREMMNLWIVDGNGAKDFSVWPLFALLLLSLPIHLFTIFDYKNRKRQVSTCSVMLLLDAAWYVTYGLMNYVSIQVGAFSFAFAVCLPLVSAILLIMARQAVKADEALLRASRRII